MGYPANSEIYLFIITGIAILNAFLGFIIYFILMYRKKQRTHQSERKDMELRFQQSLLESQLEIQEQTLRNISQEIHDNIGQVLSLAKLNLSAIELDNSGDCAERAIGAKHLVSKALQDLRDLSRSLNTDYVSQMGLGKAIEYELELINKSRLCHGELVIEGDMRSLEKQKELILFRIVQEVLNNILKHADANLIQVLLAYEADGFRLSITDNGKGFDLGQMSENARFGMGIRNMHQRATLIGAEFRINSTIGRGSAVEIRVSADSFVNH